jgi:hypothetical protein
MKEKNKNLLACLRNAGSCFAMSSLVLQDQSPLAEKVRIRGGVNKVHDQENQHF